MVVKEEAIFTVGENGHEITGLTEYGKTLTEITIPETLNGKTITGIGKDAFKNCTALTSVTIGENVTSIGSAVFYNCEALKDVTIGSNVASLGDYAFTNCLSLKFNTYDNARYLGNESNPYLLLIGATAKDVTSCTINENCKLIHGEAFNGCVALKSIVVPNGVTSIGSFAVFGCTSLNYNTYDNACYLGNESNPYLVLVRATSTKIASCKINDNCKFISNSAFEDCNSLTSIVIPKSVTSIRDEAFWGCSSLIRIAFENPNGWYVDGENLTLTDAKKNANYLTDFYPNCFLENKSDTK